MSLVDVMGASGFSGWAEAGLLLALAAFAAITIATFRGRNRERFERARLLPLEDEPRDTTEVVRATRAAQERGRER